jgi:hypothetical protein
VFLITTVILKLPAEIYATRSSVVSLN